jgi:hypothetical protein
MTELVPAHLHVPALPLTVFGTGREWIENLGFGWHAVPEWGLGRWNLGDWPLVIVVHLDDRDHGVYAVATYTNGKIETRAFTDKSERDAVTDEIAAEQWRSTGEGPPDLPPEDEPLAYHKGRFTPERHHADKGQLAQTQSSQAPQADTAENR